MAGQTASPVGGEPPVPAVPGGPVRPGGGPAGPGGPAADSVGYERKWWILGTVMVGTVMGPLDASVVNIALPTLTKYFGVEITTVEWVVIAYLLAISTLLLTFGRLGDMVGLKKLYLAGFVVFTAGSLACALSWNVWALVAFRMVQGIGAGMLFAVGPAIITQSFPPSERGRALGFMGVAVAVGLALGPTMGGLIIGLAGWRWIFLINIPIGIVAFVLASRVLRTEAPKDQRFDPLGAVFSFLALFSLLLVLSKGESWGWSSPLVMTLMAVCVLSAAAFLITETRVPQPILDLSLFRNRLFTASVLSATASYVVTASVLFLMPFYLQRVRGFSVVHSGLLLTAIPLMTALIGPLSGSLSDRIGSRFLSTTGLLISSVGAASLATLGLTTSAAGIVGRLGLIGVGMGLFQSPNSSAIMGSVPRPRLGIASGMVATARNVGMVLGVSLAGFILAIREPGYLAEALTTLPQAAAEKEAFLHAIHDAALAAAVICLLGALTSSVRGATPAAAPSGSARVRPGEPSGVGAGVAGGKPPETAGAGQRPT